VVLVSITSDCDWWDFIAQRVRWRPGHYKVIVGGQGVLNVRPFLEYADYFVLGRAEGVIDKLIKCIESGKRIDNKSVIESKRFDPDKKYYINQVDDIYPHELTLGGGKKYQEDTIGCNHKCMYCGYTWQRKHSNKSAFEYSGLWNGGSDRERAMIDMDNGVDVDLNKLRTTAIDGMSERLRFKANKKISREMLRNFIERLAQCEKPHQVKFYNIIGYPSETMDDWMEFKEDIKIVDSKMKKRDKQTCILLHSTPFRAMPATPWACEPMLYENLRGQIGKRLGPQNKGNIFYQGNVLWAVESMATDSLSTVILSTIVWRATEKDADSIRKVALSKKFWRSSSKIKQATLENYFDVKNLFKELSYDELPTKYLNTYSNIEKYITNRKAVQLNGKDIITDPGGRVDPPSAGKGS
jgi:radical SAM superfamily enzyme YgiQ (UPF0313 family)